MKKDDTGLLLKLMEFAFSKLHYISLGKVIEKDSPRRLDFYILSWVSFEIIVIIWLALAQINRAAVIAIIVLLSYHLLEIAITSFNSVIIAPLLHKKHHSIPRLFILVLIDYVEVILSFGIIFDIAFGQDSILKGLFFSVSLGTLSGTSFDNPTTALYVASIFEMLLGIFFVTGVIAAIANYLGEKE